MSDHHAPGPVPTDCTDGKSNTKDPDVTRVNSPSDADPASASVQSVAGSSNGLDRRDALKAMAAASGLVALTTRVAAQGTPAAQHPVPLPARLGPRGTPTDPDLLHPRADWPRKLSARELATLAVLCDTIIPADAKSPAASTVGVPAYINEYVSAPYDGQMRDLVRVRGGLAWLNTESAQRFGRGFAQLTAAERTQICDDICYLPKAKPEFHAAARFFDLVRDLSATGFYTTDAGMKDLEYMGNVALPKFVGTPPAVMKQLGLG